MVLEILCLFEECVCSLNLSNSFEHIFHSSHAQDSFWRPDISLRIFLSEVIQLLKCFLLLLIGLAFDHDAFGDFISQDVQSLAGPFHELQIGSAVWVEAVTATLSQDSLHGWEGVFHLLSQWHELTPEHMLSLLL